MVNVYEKKIDSLRLKIHNVSEDNRDAKNKADIINGTGTQSLKQKVHLDCTPSLGGKEYGGGDATIGGLVKEDGHSPVVEYRWTVNGKMAWNSQDVLDPFNLGSYEGDGGCTPAFNLQRQVGAGRNKVECWAVVAENYNGGVGVESNKVSWWVD